MIERLTIKGFKRFKFLSVDLSPLSVLTGTNASGKSTTLQAITIAHEAELAVSDYLSLGSSNGLGIGTVADALNHETDDSSISITIDYRALPPREYVLIAEGDDADRPVAEIFSRPAERLPSGLQVQYLGPERVGPRITSPVHRASASEARVGTDGRFTASVLASNSRQPVPEARRHPDEQASLTLQGQVERWLSEFVGPTQIQANLVTGTDIATLQFREGGNLSEWVSPNNTGFGLTYCLPVIVAALSAPVGSTLVIDSPEAHLHPSAQSRMGAFLAQMASGDLQVITETHSDHVINGLRRGFRRSNILGAEDVAIWYFDANRRVRIEMLPDGRLGDWPEGFFDQMSLDLSELTKPLP